MAMSVTYVTVHGRLREETRGGVTTRYLGDTLGSVIKTTDTSGNVSSTTTYWPFGEVRTQTGTNPSPWGFCGVWGYLTDAVSRMYVRARHYRADTSRWLSVDPLWPRQSAYHYAADDPISNYDPTGLAAWGIIALLLAGVITCAIAGH
jgi:RHS repeat-associated protein